MSCVPSAESSSRCSASRYVHLQVTALAALSVLFQERDRGDEEDAQEMAAQDQQRKEVAELKNSADTLIWQSESQLEEFKDKIEEFRRYNT